MLKRIFSAFSAVILLLICSAVTVAAAGDEVYYIYSDNDLTLLNRHPDATFYLTDDIFLSDGVEMFCPTEDKPFSGTLDGRGYTIVYIDIETESDTAAFIGYSTGTIKSLNFVRAEIGSTSETATVAGIVAYNRGVITDCSFSGKLYRADEAIYGKGIAAFNEGEIINCVDKTVKTESTIATESSVSSDSASETCSSQEVSSNEITSSDVYSTSSIILRIEHDNSSNSVAENSDNKTSSQEETSSNDSGRKRAEEYFAEAENEPQHKFDKKATVALVGTAMVGLSSLCGISIYREIKITKKDKNKIKSKK